MPEGAVISLLAVSLPPEPTLLLVRRSTNTLTRRVSPRGRCLRWGRSCSSAGTRRRGNRFWGWPRGQWRWNLYATLATLALAFAFGGPPGGLGWRFRDSHLA